IGPRPRAGRNTQSTSCWLPMMTPIAGEMSQDSIPTSERGWVRPEAGGATKSAARAGAVTAMPETTAIAERKEVEKRRDMSLSSSENILKESLSTTLNGVCRSKFRYEGELELFAGN